MSDTSRPTFRASLARSLAFTLLMIYGLLSFLMGYGDWSGARRMPEWADWGLLAFGLLLGAAAVRVMLRRRKAFGQSAVGLLGLLALDLAADLYPGAEDDWRHLLARALLSGVILFLVRRADRALPGAAAPNP